MSEEEKSRGKGREIQEEKKERTRRRKFNNNIFVTSLCLMGASIAQWYSVGPRAR
jgi:hypothetical protein